MNPAENPYRTTLNNPFYGREEIFRWIDSQLPGPLPAQPLLLIGPPGSGKTAILKQLEAGRLDRTEGEEERYCFLYVPLAGIPREDEERFLWAVAQQAEQSVRRQGMRPLLLRLQPFAGDTPDTFLEKVVQPVLAQRGDDELVLMLDDVEPLVGPAARETGRDLRSLLHQLVQVEPRLRYLFTYTGTASEETPDMAPFPAPHTHVIGPLSHEAVHALVQEPAPFSVYSGVTEYIAATTKGQPTVIRRLCQALYEQWQTDRIRQITVADVVRVERKLAN
ncbi:MAG: ATP-binding protein [Candidatus Promineifilaceae bacterium]|nr:ATP-binding protein [Candidatus Promineifilaceae bacterium]